MPIDALTSVALSQMPSNSVSAASDISVAMLSKQLEVSQEMSDSMLKAMEQSVNPGIGGNIDVYA